MRSRDQSRPFFFFNDTATTEIYTLSLHDALPISFLIDSLTAHAHALRKIGQEREASQIEMRVEAIRLRYPQGSVQCVLRGTVRPIKRNLQWRLSLVVSAPIYPLPVLPIEHLRDPFRF